MKNVLLLVPIRVALQDNSKMYFLFKSCFANCTIIFKANVFDCTNTKTNWQSVQTQDEQDVPHTAHPAKPSTRSDHKFETQ